MFAKVGRLQRYTQHFKVCTENITISLADPRVKCKFLLGTKNTGETWLLYPPSLTLQEQLGKYYADQT